jgi:indole-3-glycerol phosphate synthase
MDVDSGSDTLAHICATTLEEVKRRREEHPLAQLEAKLRRHRDRPRNFGVALKEQVGRDGYGLITEIKKQSPSAGLIRADFDPAELARIYAEAGATCLSVLTDAPFFDGAPEHLKAARAAVDLPVLRKDFILDPWQVYESRLIGADCILLIMAALTNEQARELEELARALEMDVLVEVHNRRELERALGLQTQLIGINNRNLKTLNTDLQTTAELAPLVPSDRFLISESGIRSHRDIVWLCEHGARCFLVGESLLRQPDLGAATRALLNG